MNALFNRYLEAAFRDPREFPIGYLAADGPTGALAPFLWFRGEAELLRFVATTELGLLRLNPPAHAGVTAALSAVLRSGLDRQRSIATLTDAFRGWTEILWIGSFAELCHEEGAIPSSLRAEYRWTMHDSENDAALDPAESAELVGFLRSLAERCRTVPTAGAPAVGGATRRSG